MLRTLATVAVLPLVAAALTAAAFAVLLTVAAFAPACSTEDATGTVCTWDAGDRGNGTGDSFLVVGQRVIYLPTI